MGFIPSQGTALHHGPRSQVREVRAAGSGPGRSIAGRAAGRMFCLRAGQAESGHKKNPGARTPGRRARRWAGSDQIDTGDQLVADHLTGGLARPDTRISSHALQRHNKRHGEARQTGGGPGAGKRKTRATGRRSAPGGTFDTIGGAGTAGKCDAIKKGAAVGPPRRRRLCRRALCGH